MIDRIHLAHGSGKGLSDILSRVVVPVLSPIASVLEDAAIIKSANGRLAFTTDSFVVSPIEFPGGDIGKLAACGTINDLAMMGAIPTHMAVSLILEEGLELTVLTKVLESLSAVCRGAGVQISCGDTKVVEHGKADRLFITTTGIGSVPPGLSLSAANLKEGDAILVSGSIGRHGIAIMAARQNLGFASSVVSDCAPLNQLAEALVAAVPSVRTMRDATRGGVAAVLNELADASHVTIEIAERKIPVSASVAGACSLMGLDPLVVANEGTFVAAIPEEDCEKALSALRSHPLGAQACKIGAVKSRGRFGAVIETVIGGLRPIMLPPGEVLPRIC